MKLILEVQDSKAKVFMAFLESLTYVKSKTLTPEKEEIINGLKEAVDEVNLIRKGKLKGIPARQLYNEL